MAGFSTRVRDAAITSVNWPPARTTIKRGAHAAARVRGRYLDARGALPEVANIYAASCPKAGSQWIKALFDHPVVRSHTGLFTLPQFDYWQRPLKAFPAGTFVPGLYLSHAAYDRIPKPHGYRTVYVFRDPRDIVVSGYFASFGAHPDMLGLAERRAVLQSLSVEEGLLYSLRESAQHFRDMATWVDVPADENLAIWRLEDISADPAGAVPKILAHCGVQLSDAELDQVLRETSRDELQRQDLARREPGADSHYRVERKSFRDLFTAEHYAAVEELVPGLVERLGYPS
ncbi:MAG TPA: sulfotransferase domain-containing protein [Nocardioidaceae bacterium]|nr:sulfotransferase domain-containing protein [Nocardioidaceae bacterium]